MVNVDFNFDVYRILETFIKDNIGYCKIINITTSNIIEIKCLNCKKIEVNK